MKVNLVYWLDKIGGTIDRIQIDLKPFGYKLSPVTQWKMLIADEDVTVEKGTPTVIKVKNITLPGNTMVGPLSIMRHALGTVKDIVECGIPDKIEGEKCIDQVLFIPVESGEIKKGDLVGVLKVFFVKTGLLTTLIGLSPPKVELKEEVAEAFLTWRDDGNIYRKKIKTSVLGYAESQIGVWELLIADESVKVNKGDIVRVKIKEVTLPPNTVVVPLTIMRHAYGTVLDVIQLGKPSKVEEEKKIHQAIFLAVDDGKIEEGDLIGVINVNYVGTTTSDSILVERESQKVNIVYRSGLGIIRKEIKLNQFGYKRSNTAKWECLVAAERKKVKCGEPAVVKVRRILVPENTIVYPLSIMRHAYGTVVDVFCDCPPWKVEEGGSITKIVFLPIMDGEIREGELLGVLNFYQVEVGSLQKIKSWYNRWIRMSDSELLAYIEGVQ